MGEIVKLSILVEDIGDGELSPFITTEPTLEQAQEQFPNVVALHSMTLTDAVNDAGFGIKRQQMASTFSALMVLSGNMHECDIEDLFMQFFQEGMKAGIQYAIESGMTRPAETA